MRIPKWHMELELFRAFKTTFVMEGNIFDLQSYPFFEESHKEAGTTAIEDRKVARWELLTLDNYLYQYLLDHGYETVLFYNPVDGFYNVFDETALQRFLQEEKKPEESCYPATLGRGVELIRDFLKQRRGAHAIIMNLASRYVSSPGHLTEEEQQAYTKMLLTSLKQTQVRSPMGLVNNLLFVIANKTNDIPAWFYLDNPQVKVLNIDYPDQDMRRNFIDTQCRFFPQQDQVDPEQLERLKERFVSLTEGFRNVELNGLRILSKQESIPFSQVEDAITLFKHGVKRNPWREIQQEKLQGINEAIKRRVKGQDHCIQQAVDIIKRSVTGLSGLQHSGASSKPKGVLFFAGPTGTGKTELAKTIAEWLFGEEQSCVRFDMSEYQQGHSDQKLLGAPPGYVGYEAGGQLTNAVKKRPFSILLFDEIEKAHPSIFDKFLQILEDGRMTDGQGETVHFSDALIVFTSNLGVYQKAADGSRRAVVTPEMAYEEIQEQIMKAVKEFFLIELGRPEILNRIGNNFIVFDYIRPPVASVILDSQIKRIGENLLQNKRIQLQLSSGARETLYNKALKNLENGGRGIGNIVEKYLINPLSRYIFDHQVEGNSRLVVDELLLQGDLVELVCQNFSEEAPSTESCEVNENEYQQGNQRVASDHGDVCSGSDEAEKLDKGSN